MKIIQEEKLNDKTLILLTKMEFFLLKDGIESIFNGKVIIKDQLDLLKQIINFK